MTTLASIAADIAGEFENVFTATMTAGSDLRDSEPIWCVDLKWNARGVSRATSPMIQLLRAFGESPQMLALSDTCREDPRSRLAIEASQLAGSSLYLSYSDTLCSSYYILFDQGVIRRLSGYGMGGGEGFVQLLDAGVQARDIPLEQIRYEQPAIEGLKEFTNSDMDLDEMSERFWPDLANTTIEFRLFSKTVRVHPIEGTRRSGQALDEPK